MRRVLRKNVTKNAHLLGFVPHIYIWTFYPIMNIVPHLEIIFFIDQHFIVCIFNYCTRSRVNYGL